MTIFRTLTLHPHNITLRITEVTVRGGACGTDGLEVTCALNDIRHDDLAGNAIDPKFCRELCPQRNQIFLKEEDIPAYTAWRLTAGNLDEE